MRSGAEQSVDRLVKLHHPNCKQDRCDVCLNDHTELGEYLKTHCGNSDRIDWLGLYRTFMDKRMGRSTETEWGWGDPVIFEQQHVQAFINDWNEV